MKWRIYLLAIAVWIGFVPGVASGDARGQWICGVHPRAAVAISLVWDYQWQVGGPATMDAFGTTEEAAMYYATGGIGYPVYACDVAVLFRGLRVRARFFDLGFPLQDWHYDARSAILP